jgi:hypothetical protein
MDILVIWLVMAISFVAIVIHGYSLKNKLLAYFYNKYGMLRIQEVVLTAQVDKAGFPTSPTSSFSQTNHRIYCFITYHVSKAVNYYRTNLLVRWYYKGKAIHYGIHSLPDDYPVLAYTKAPKNNSLRPGYFLTYIEAPTNAPFERGHYTVRLFVAHSTKVHVKTVEFEIV